MPGLVPLTVTVAVTVQDDLSSAPITTATVRVQPPSFPDLTQNTNGVYVFPALPPNDYVFFAEANGYEENSTELRNPQSIDEATIEP